MTVALIEVHMGQDGLNFCAIWAKSKDENGNEIQVTAPTVYGALYGLTKKIEEAAKEVPE